jgi:hypothetical protein
MSIAEYLGENPASVSGGVDGNAYAVMGATKRAIKKAFKCLHTGYKLFRQNPNNPCVVFFV